MGKIFMPAFLNVSKPFKANWSWRGHQAVVSQYLVLKACEHW
jgi:hypothetical protein